MIDYETDQWTVRALAPRAFHTDGRTGIKIELETETTHTLAAGDRLTIPRALELEFGHG